MRRGGGPTAAAVWWGTAGCAAVCAYAVVGYFHILVWNPQAAVPGTSLNGIHRQLADNGASLSEPLVIAWAAFGCLAAGVVLVVSLLGRLPSVRVAANWHLGLLALAAPALYIASFSANTALANTFAVRGASPWGMVLYGVSAAAGLALLVVPVRNALRRRREAAVPIGSPGHYDEEFHGFPADRLLHTAELPVIPFAAPSVAVSTAREAAAGPAREAAAGPSARETAAAPSAREAAAGKPGWVVPRADPLPVGVPARTSPLPANRMAAESAGAAVVVRPGAGAGAARPAAVAAPPTPVPATPAPAAPAASPAAARAPDTEELPSGTAPEPPVLSVPLSEEEAATMSQFSPTPPPINVPAPVPFAAPGQRAASPAPQASLRDTLRTLRSAPAGTQKPRQVSLLRDDPAKPDVVSLLAQNRDLLYPGLGAGAVGLTPPYLKDPSVTFWTVRENGTLLGCGALKEFRPEPGNGITEFCGEITSMRTSPHARGLGVGQIILQQIITDARTRGYASLLLETGTQDFFASSRRLYQRSGFVTCPPFGKYRADPGSIFMRLDLQPAPTDATAAPDAASSPDGGASGGASAAAAGAASGAAGAAPAAPVHAKAGTLSAILAAQRAIATTPPRQR